MRDVAGKIAFITGGASGLGLAMARSFTAAGMKVVIADIQDDALAAAREEYSETNLIAGQPIDRSTAFEDHHENHR